MPLLAELGLNGLHVEKGTPKLDQALIVSRGDQFKLAFCFAAKNREDCFALFDVRPRSPTTTGPALRRWWTANT
jgi:hypothetical protein